MNDRRTSGKNLQTLFTGADDETAYENRASSTSGPSDPPTQHIYSLAERQRSLPSLPVQQPQPRPARKYGGRRMRYHWSNKLKPWQVHDWYAADSNATQLDVPLNTFMTICWGVTFPGSAAMPLTFRRGMKRMAQWLRDHGCVFAYVYVHENPDDRLNTHILMHVPTHLRRFFKAKADEWFEALDGGVRIDPRNDRDRVTKRLGTRLQYMAKGADDQVCRSHDGRRQRGGQGTIEIKRSGVAQCLRGKPQFSDAIKAPNNG